MKKAGRILLIFFTFGFFYSGCTARQASQPSNPTLVEPALSRINPASSLLPPIPSLLIPSGPQATQSLHNDPGITSTSVQSSLDHPSAQNPSPSPTATSTTVDPSPWTTLSNGARVSDNCEPWFNSEQGVSLIPYLETALNEVKIYAEACSSQFSLREPSFAVSLINRLDISCLNNQGHPEAAAGSVASFRRYTHVNFEMVDSERSGGRLKMALFRRNILPKTLFHELLHFTHADNYSSDLHNSVHDPRWESARFGLDRIYFIEGLCTPRTVHSVFDFRGNDLNYTSSFNSVADGVWLNRDHLNPSDREVFLNPIHQNRVGSAGNLPLCLQTLTLSDSSFGHQSPINYTLEQATQICTRIRETYRYYWQVTENAGQRVREFFNILSTIPQAAAQSQNYNFILDQFQGLYILEGELRAGGLTDGTHALNIVSYMRVLESLIGGLRTNPGWQSFLQNLQTLQTQLRDPRLSVFLPFRDRIY